MFKCYLLICRKVKIISFKKNQKSVRRRNGIAIRRYLKALTRFVGNLEKNLTAHTAKFPKQNNTIK